MGNVSSQLVRYGLVGVINTAITFSVIVVLMYLGVSAVTSNVIGYAFGLLNSYLMNRQFTFNAPKAQKRALRFLSGFFIAYGLNLVALVLLMQTGIVPVLVAQLVAMIIYNASFFIAMKCWIFIEQT